MSTFIETFVTDTKVLTDIPPFLKLVESGNDYNVYDSKFLNIKVFKSPNHNYAFDLVTGDMEIFGTTREEEPIGRFPAPNILDLEVTTICGGIKGKGPCAFCYKSNTTKGENMSFDTFKTIFDKLPKSITQIAFGADATLTSNPEIWEMMKYARENRVVPNVTLADCSDEVVDNLVKYCGAVAISDYNKDVCYNSVKKLTDRGMRQVNIHYMISEETFSGAKELLKDCLTDERLSNLNAVVFLSLKKKGRGTSHNTLSQDKFTELVKFAHENNIGIGFDSCSSLKALVAYNEIGVDVRNYIIPCEASMQSSYINVKGEYFPCSFCEGEPGWESGLSVLSCNNFLDDVWNHPKTKLFSDMLNNTCSNNCLNCRNCPMFNV